MDDIVARIYGTVTVDRFAFSRVMPQPIEQEEIREFSGIEASSPAQLGVSAAITSSAGTSTSTITYSY